MSDPSNTIGLKLEQLNQLESHKTDKGKEKQIEDLTSQLQVLSASENSPQGSTLPLAGHSLYGKVSASDSTPVLRPDIFGRIRRTEMSFFDHLIQPPVPHPQRNPYHVPHISQPKVSLEYPARNVVIHLVRHAQGPHNLSQIPAEQRWSLLNPGLTKRGIAESVLLRKRFEPMDRITHILCSPLHRTLRTALVAFHPIIQKGLQVIAWPEIREYGSSPCSSGSDLAVLLSKLYHAEKVTRDCVDTTLVPDGWEIQYEGKTGEEVREFRAKRALIALQKLRSLGIEATKEANGAWEGHEVHQGRDVEIVVVSHSAFIVDLERATGKPVVYHNAEYKSYRFPTKAEVDSGVHYLRLLQTEESKLRAHELPWDYHENGLAAI